MNLLAAPATHLLVNLADPGLRSVLGLAPLFPLVLVWVWCRHLPRPARRALRAGAGLATACALGAAAAWTSDPVGSGRTALWVLLGSGALFAAVAASVARLDARARDLGWQHHHDRLRVLDAALGASRDGVLVTATSSDAVGLRIVYANPAFEELTGYGTDEAIGQSPSMLYNQSPPADREIVQEALRAGTPGRFEVHARRKDGSRVWVEWSVVPVPESADGCEYRIAVLRDTTERKRLEKQLCRAAKLEAVGQLAAGIAHDFNNLLTVIGGNATLLSDITYGTPEAARLVDEVRFATDRAGGLVRQLLAFSRPPAATRTFVDLGRVVSDFAAIVRRVLGPGIVTEIDTPADPVPVAADRGQLEQVLMNLSVNARDVMPGGGRLRLTVRAVGGAARLEVSDSGCGMTERVKARIFEPFFTTKGPDKGTGLGLATVQRIVQQSGGTIAVESAVGVGTSFRIELPLTPGAPPVPPGKPQREEHRPTGRRASILLVEDEPRIRALARGALEGSGFHVTEAADGVRALEHLDSGHSFHLVLTDLSVPGAGGALVAARARARRPDVGIVFMSGGAAPGSSVPGAVFLAKPFSPDDLVRTVEAAIAGTHKSENVIPAGAFAPGPVARVA